MEDDKARQLLNDERTRLEGLRKRIDDPGVETQEDSLSELTTADQHPADVGSETFERTKNLSLQEDVDGRLADVDRALEKLDAGTFGTCETCGNPIPDERLEAVPGARYCVEHQAQQERTVPAE
ncbi:MAG TPA: TraR/DksA C4-type zinc finger protein [Actinomycetota bacterium]|nr:TraR/DksA C4-type zinc finger protein [Actinomycetota bacterium]